MRDIYGVTIGYFEAWQMWFGGQQPPGDAAMWHVSVRWWGRAGKIAAFLGGATVILDLIGPEQLRQWGRRTADTREKMELMAELAGAIVLIAASVAAAVAVLELVDSGTPVMPSAILVVLVTGFMLYVGLRLFKSFNDESLAKAIAATFLRLLDRDRPAQAIRYASVYILLVGFHFDLLAS